jgi:hypothetical protein
MTVTVASFLAEFEEFDPGDSSRDVLVQAKIDAASLRTNAEVWGDMRDEGIKHLAAHLLALSPYARELKLANNDGETIYLAQRRAMEMAVVSGYRVTGEVGDV